MKIAVVTDSTTYLSEEQYRNLEIYRLPLSVIFTDGIYQEGIDIQEAEFYKKVRDAEYLPTSSQPASGEILDLFEELSQKYDAVISINLSSKISGTYQNVVNMATHVDGLKVYPYDSGISCAPQAYMVLEAARMAKDGASIEAILTKMDEMKKSLKAYFVVDDLNNLVRGGRLSNGSAMIGSLLKIKPILYFEDKKIVVFEKIRTKKKALKRIEGLLNEDLKSEESFIATIIHANAEEEAQEWKKHLTNCYPNVRFEISYFGPVIGTHLGECALGMSWVKDPFTY